MATDVEALGFGVLAEVFGEVSPAEPIGRKEVRNEVTNPSCCAADLTQLLNPAA